MKPNLWKSRGGFVLAFAFGLSLAGAVWGFMDQGKGFLNAVYLSLQLIVLNVDTSSGPINWQLQITRFSLPGIAAYATISGFLSLAGLHAHFLKLKWFPPETIFLGAGRIAVGLTDRLEATQPVVALDLDVDQIHARALKSKGIRLIAGDATDSGMLRKLNVAKAKYIYVATEDDRRNLDIAHEIVDLIEKEGNKPRLVVAISDRTLLRLARLDKCFVEYRTSGGTITWFDAPAQAARVLLRDFPPDREREPTSGPPIHIAVAGLGILGQAIVLQIARNCVYSDERRIRVSVFAPDRNAYEDLLSRHPAMDAGKPDPAYGGFVPMVDLSFIPYQDGAAAPAAIRKAQEGCPFTLVYVAMEDDYTSLATAMRFMQSIYATDGRCKVVCVLPGTRFGTEAGARAMAEGNAEAFDGIELFHAINRSVRYGEAYPGADSDLLGIAIDAAYRAGDDIGPLTPSQEMFESQKLDWEERLDDDYRWSSRHSADHIPVKLRALGYDVIDERTSSVDGADPEKLRSAIEENLDMLQHLEHRRFCQERLVDGWLKSNAGGQKKAMHLNSTIVPYDELDAKDKAKDERIVRIIPDLIQLAKLALIKRNRQI